MRKKRDILFLCQFYHPEYISSAQLPHDTVLALTGAGFTVDVLCGYPREYLQGKDIPLREELDGISIRRLRYLQLDRSGFLGRLVNYFSFTFMVLLQLFSLAKYRAVVVYSNPPVLPWIASWGKVIFGCKLVFVSYDLYPEVATVTNTLTPGNLICRLMEHINRCVFRRADRVVALSGEMKDYIAQHRPIQPEKILVIPNWYRDEGIQDRDPEKNSLRELVRDRFTVSYFGNMGTMQDMHTVLGAIRLLKEEEGVFFLFAGHGNKMESLRMKLEEERLTNARVVPFLHGQQFRDALAVSDCALVTLEQGTTGLCVPSKTYSYMMQGIPLAVIMGESDIVQDVRAGAGFWVQNGDSEGLARQIQALRHSPETLERMRKVCREIYLEKYTVEICTGKYVDLFRELLSGASMEEEKK